MRSQLQQNYRGQNYKACTLQDATQRPDIYKYSNKYIRSCPPAAMDTFNNFRIVHYKFTALLWFRWLQLE